MLCTGIHQLDDSDVRAIDRFVRPKDKSKPSAYLVCVVVTRPQTAVQFATAMCVACRRAQGRRISPELSGTCGGSKVSETALACPHCGIIAIAPSATSAASLLASPVLADLARVLVYGHVKATTLHRIAELWASSSSASVPLARASLSPQMQTDRHTGLTVDSFFSEVERHWAIGKRGVFLPEQQMPPMALSTSDTGGILAAISGNNQELHVRSASA